MITQLTNLLGLSPKGDVTESATTQKSPVAFSDVFEKMSENMPEREDQPEQKLVTTDDVETADAGVVDAADEVETNEDKLGFADSDEWRLAEKEVGAPFEPAPERFVQDRQEFVGDASKFAEFASHQEHLGKEHLGPVAAPTLASMLVRGPSETQQRLDPLAQGQTPFNRTIGLAMGSHEEPLKSVSSIAVRVDIENPMGSATPKGDASQNPELEGWTAFKPDKRGGGHTIETAVPLAQGTKFLKTAPQIGIGAPQALDQSTAGQIEGRANGQAAPAGLLSTISAAESLRRSEPPNMAKVVARDIGVVQQREAHATAQPIRAASDLSKPTFASDPAANGSLQSQPTPPALSNKESQAGMTALDVQVAPEMAIARPELPRGGHQRQDSVLPAELGPQIPGVFTDMKTGASDISGLEYQRALPIGSEASSKTSQQSVQAAQVTAAQSAAPRVDLTKTPASPDQNPEPAQTPVAEIPSVNVSIKKTPEMTVEVRQIEPAAQSVFPASTVQSSARQAASGDVAIGKLTEQTAEQMQPKTSLNSALGQGRGVDQESIPPVRSFASEDPEMRVTFTAPRASASAIQSEQTVEMTRAAVPLGSDSPVLKASDPVSPAPDQATQLVRGGHSAVNASVIALPTGASAGTAAPMVPTPEISPRDRIRRNLRTDGQSAPAQSPASYSMAEIKLPTSAAASIQLATAQVTNPAVMDPSIVPDDAKTMDFATAFSLEEVRPQAQGGVALPSGTPGARENAAAVLRQMNDMLPRLSEGSIDIRLSPEELGKVRMQLVPSDQGMTVHIQADRPETLDLLRRHVDQLAKDLSDAGFESTGFTFAGGDSQGGSDGEPSGFGNGGAQAAPTIESQVIEETSQTPQSDDGLDIRM